MTALHRALGQRAGGEPGPATAISGGLLVAAVSAEVVERADLDWKRRLPDLKVAGAREEAAKDIAAMANTSGGLIVYGVREAGGGAAAAIEPAASEAGDQFERMYRQVASSAIRPPVLGLRFHRVAVEGGWVLAVEVDPSQERPHLVFSKDLFRAPYRSGSHTLDMDEAALSRAYRDRHRFSDDRRNHLQRLYQEARASALDEPATLHWMGEERDDPSRRAVLVLVAVADGYVPSLDRLTRDRVYVVMGGRQGSPKQRLRGWDLDEQGYGGFGWTRFHQDGSVSAALPITSARAFDGTAFSFPAAGSLHLLEAVERLVTSASRWVEVTGYSGSHLLRVGIETSGHVPARIVSHVGSSTRYIEHRDAVPVSGAPIQFSLDLTPNRLEESWQSVLRDLLNLGGLPYDFR